MDQLIGFLTNLINLKLSLFLPPQYQLSVGMWLAVLAVVILLVITIIRIIGDVIGFLRH